jgi:hypothetical protein
MVLKILQPNNNRKKEKMEGSKAIEEEGIVGSNIPIGLGE